MTGENILNYRIDTLISEDSLFRSFLATHTQFSKKVVVKALKPLASESEKQQFYEEIRRFAQVQHPHVFTIYDQLETPEEYFLVLEYVDGRSLADYIQNVSGPIPESKARALFVQILEAFASAHQKGVMNGAIHPDHIFLTAHDQIKVTDLALSSFYRKKMTDLGDKEAISYLSPEQVEGKFFDLRSDIYALGVLLFQILCGKHPYSGLSIAQIQQKITQEPLPPTRDFYPMISPDIEKLIQKATAKNPQDRFQSCAEFKQAVLALKEQATIQADPVPHQQAKVEPVKPETKPVKKKIDISTYEKINVIPYFLGGLSTFLLVMLFVYYWGGESADSEVLYQVSDTQKVQSRQDSIAKAQSRKAIDDSIQRFSEIKKKITVIEPFIHKVGRRGETLDKIARRYLVTLDTLKKLNNLTGRERLNKNEGVKIPVKAIYKLKKDEDLNIVAQKYNISPFILKEVNQLYPKPPKEVGGLPEPVIFEGKDIVIPLMMNQKK
jgi:serine/threonine protein kinase